MGKQEQIKNSLRPLSFGFFLIIVVVAIFLLRPVFFPEKKSVSPEENGPWAEDLEKYKGISVADLAKKTRENDSFTIIDLRNAENFEAEHILNSRNVPFSDFEIFIEEMNNQEEYVLVDDIGLTPNEKTAIDFLTSAGFENIYFLEGGLFGWKNEFQPTVSSGNPYSFADQSKVSYIISDDLKDMILKENNLYIIDLRASSEFSAGHISKAINIPLADLEIRHGEILPGKKIIVYDNDVLGAFRGAVRLFDAGIMNVFALSDGLNVWKEKGFEVVK